MVSFLKTLISAVLAFIMAILPGAGSGDTEKKCEAEFNGTFVQSWMSCQWDDARWQEEISYMKQHGVEYLVLQDIANMSSDGKWQIFYDSQLETFEDADFKGDVIDAALRNCNGTGIKVFVGLAMFDSFWTTGTLTDTYNKVCSVAAEMAQEIYSKYYEKYSDSFYGWYFTPEINNILICELNFAGACRGLNTVLDKVDEIDSSLPMLLSPFTSKYLASGPIKTLSDWVTFFSLAHLRDGDIFAPQDAVGAGWISESELDTVWKMYKTAINTAEADIKLWANCENFTVAVADSFGAGVIARPETENKENVTASLDRFIRQMEIASKYAENIITFSYSHYYSPGKVDPCFINTYMDYINNGHVLETQAPTAAENFIKVKDGENVVLTWEASQDNFGISHYRILKDGKFLTRIECLYGSPELTFTDENGDINSEYTIIAYDAAGNCSVETGAR